MSIRNAFPGGRLNPFGASRPGRSVVLVLFRTIRLGEWIFRQRSCTKACHRGGSDGGFVVQRHGGASLRWAPEYSLRRAF